MITDRKRVYGVYMYCNKPEYEVGISFGLVTPASSVSNKGQGVYEHRPGVSRRDRHTVREYTK